ncbi:hypothetical protein GJAV_G00165380 [Gymnothorax javanicus]|nr:hypothetical protein GJAV_G00165380 [Gymnothorax javanicus]
MLDFLGALAPEPPRRRCPLISPGPRQETPPHNSFDLALHRNCNYTTNLWARLELGIASKNAPGLGSTTKYQMCGFQLRVGKKNLDRASLFNHCFFKGWEGLCCDWL